MVEGYKFFGSPYCTEFYDWGFMVKDEVLTEKYGQIPDDTEILVTHQPPYNILDWFPSTPLNDPKRCGSKVLADELNKRLRPLYHIFGHIHEGYGQVH